MLDAKPGLYIVTSAFMLVGLTWLRKYRDNHSRPPLPPGPPTIPILGSILSLDDPVRPWLTFHSWGSKYGDIIYARLFNKPVVVVNSEEVARDLFELRSTIYSDRPQSIAFDHFATDYNVVFMPYGDRWRLHRRIIHQSFRAGAIPAYQPELRRSAHKMLFSFLQHPVNYTSHFEMFISSFILPIIYAYEPKVKDDHIIHVMRSFMDIMVASLGVGTTMIMETFPFLLQLPVWFPGATFKRASVKCLQAAHDMKELPFQCVKERMSIGEMPLCVVADSMHRMDGFESDIIQNAIKEVACMVFGAANETTSGTLLVFLLVMVLHPDIQAKAQMDIDRVIGKDRLPDFSDRPALPYLDAILRETLRWNPVAPMGVPHTTTVSDIYRGYFIPKGVPVIANIWAMTHNKSKYPSPEEFKPERFLREDGSLTDDVMSLAFGWGRRICAGQYLADTALWIAMASFLAAFSVHKALDERGKEIPVTPKFSNGITSYPETFPCRIVPRFRDASAERLTQLTMNLPVN